MPPVAPGRGTPPAVPPYGPASYGPPSYGPPSYGPAPYGPPSYPGPPGYPSPPFPGAPFGVDPYGRPYSDRSKIAAGVLQLFLGNVGAGRWYTGHYGIALAQLLTCGGLGIWAPVDGIVLLATDSTDAEGRLLRS